jgi:hypothetical protein
VGDDDNMIGDRRLTLQRLAYPDEVLNYVLASPHGQNVARGGRQIPHWVLLSRFVAPLARTRLGMLGAV